ncbi:MAG: protein kinase, partial [Clostridiales bacterium]|nr:protein kinase [Clostridiales bacterium]
MGTRILAGRYELLERIGDGGMAVVYKARCRLLNRFVAIKILKPDFIKDAKFIENFRKESQAAASLSHPNIVNVYDVGREGNINYIVMELIEGKVLSDVIREEAPIDYMRAIEIAKQLASALSLAHKNQIIHRDVKPLNILITQDGIPKITDFGIAKAVNAETLVGSDGTIMGSVHYFSPEQARGGYVDERSDIYSLGIVLYEMLTGRVPFDGENPVNIALMHVNDEMVPPGKIAAGIPPRLEQIVMKA